MNSASHHKLHIPVMGLAFTIDSPVKVARFGISSVISIMEDRLIEMMRSYYYPRYHQQYVPINTKEPDYRSRRITDYLNLVGTIVREQVAKMRTEPFEAGSEIVKYFELLPADNSTRQLYDIMNSTDSDFEKNDLQEFLRTQVKAGSIDVNIMTKLDRNQLDENGVVVVAGSDAVAALRGYVNSELENSSVIFSAGLNPRLYNYLENCPQFDADKNGHFKKKVTIKVSDYRSAIIQGKYLAKKGVWVSEFRIESGLNCGGHAFATDGYLMGPILQEFKDNKEELVQSIFEIYKAAPVRKGHEVLEQAPPLKISAQGGIGTAGEDKFLHEHYGIDSTGWGTPFLLVPEATTVDARTLELLAKAKQTDVYLSNNSPLGVRFYALKGTSAETEKTGRIEKGQPGSPCTEKHLVTNTEFTKEPICTASKQYQRLKQAQLRALQLPAEEYSKQLQKVLDKECLCIGLSNAASHQYQVPFLKKLEAVSICPGPNISWFNEVISLEKMTAHIYGKTDLLQGSNRPHMFINELNLYVDFLKEKLSESNLLTDTKAYKYCQVFLQQLTAGIAYYRTVPALAKRNCKKFLEGLESAEQALEILAEKYGLAEKQFAAGDLVPG